MTTIRAEVICDSIAAHSPRLTTFKLRYHKFIHSEFMTHRMLTRNASSSRAVPVSKLIEEVRNDATRAAPVWWGAEQKGMQSGEELKDYALEHAENLWVDAALDATTTATLMVKRGVHKSIVNRLLEPFSHINVVATGTEDAWLNFFGLRLDKAAQPEMRVLAELMWAAWDKSTPNLLIAGHWHLPFVPYEHDGFITDRYVANPKESVAIRISVARCARVSYESFETQKLSTVEEDLKLYDRLVGAQPLHASPAEHQAMPDTRWIIPQKRFEGGKVFDDHQLGTWMNQDQHGNFPGWRQYRKMLPDERIAPLPASYTYRVPK